MTFYRFTNAKSSTAVFFLAHSGESHNRSSESQKTETSATSESTPVPASQQTQPTEIVKPSQTPVELFTSSGGRDQITLASSVMGFPFGLGELSFSLILVGPVFLSAIRRWMQS